MKLNKLKANKGFSLVEIIIVAGIAGLLATVAVSGFISAGRRGRDAKRVADMLEIQNALQLYFSNNDVYPNETMAGSGLAGWEISYEPDFMEYLRPYLPRVPTDPLNFGPPTDMFATRPDGTYFYNYHRYDPTPAIPDPGAFYGCSWSGTFAVLGFRSAEFGDKSKLPKAQCGPMPCPGGGIPNVCRDWSNEFDYSVFLVPGRILTPPL